MNLQRSHILMTLFFLIFIFCYKMNAQIRFEYKSNQMGTEIKLIFYTKNKVNADRIAHDVFKKIEDLNKIMSSYIVDSEINVLSRQSNINVRVSDDLYAILKLAFEYSIKTKGSFDITVGPYITLWEKVKIERNLPSKSELSELNRIVGYKNIEFPKGKNMVCLKENDMQLDLGGIGKGYTADEVLKILEFNGVKSALIDMGGDIRVSEPPPNKEYWTLAFSYYDDDKKGKVQKVKLKNKSIATSGDLFRYIEIDGVRYSHIINPTNGMALTSNIQVTVIASNTLKADVYASALSVLGIDKAMEFVNKENNIDVFMVQSYKKEIKQWSNSNFKAFLMN